MQNTIDEYPGNTIDILSNSLHCKKCGTLNDFPDGKLNNRKIEFDEILNSLLQTITIEECEYAIREISKAMIEKAKCTNDIFIAAENGNVEDVEKCLENLDVNITDAIGNTLTHCAAKNGNTDLLKVLMENGADVKMKNNNLETALHIAAKHGHKNIAIILLGKLVDINAKNKENCTPLHMACIHDHPELVSLLLSENASKNIINKDNRNPFMCATSENVLLQFLFYNVSDEEKECLLFQAIKKNWLKIVNRLIRLKVDLNAKSMDDILDSPVITAARYDRIELVKKFIANGADINYTNNRNLSALHISAKGGKLNLMELLIKSHADIDQEVEFLGRTALHYAAFNGHSEIVKCLIKHGANISVVDRNLRTPMHFAALSGDANTIAAFILAGADLEVVDAFGQSPVKILLKN